jgi:hypothetical protein
MLFVHQFARTKVSLSVSIGVVFDEVAVITCETQEFSDFHDVCWGSPVAYFLYLGVVHLYFSLGYTYA